MHLKPNNTVLFDDFYLHLESLPCTIELLNEYFKIENQFSDKIRMDLEEIGINAGNWVDSAQDRNYWRALVNAALNLRVP